MPASQAGRRRFDPGRPLSLRAVSPSGLFLLAPPIGAVAAAISRSRKRRDVAHLSIEKYDIRESARLKVATAFATGRRASRFVYWWTLQPLCRGEAIVPAGPEATRALGQIVAHELDLVRKQNQFLAAVEVDGEELATQILALRDEGARRGASDDSAREYDRTRRPAPRSRKYGHGSSPSRGSGCRQRVEIEPGALERSAQPHVPSVHHVDDR